MSDIPTGPAIWVQNGKVSSGGDVGGDYQVTDGWAVRFLLDGDGGPRTVTFDDNPRLAPGLNGKTVTLYSMVTVTAYGESLYVDQFYVDQGEAPECGISTEQEFLVCTDLADPGCTECWSEYKYGGEATDGGIYSDFAAASAQARRVAETFNPDWITWNGRMPWES
jgi:hypothetical protein